MSFWYAFYAMHIHMKGNSMGFYFQFCSLWLQYSIYLYRYSIVLCCITQVTFSHFLLQHQYHTKIDDLIERTSSSMTQGMVGKLLSVLESVISKLGRYDEGSFIGSILSFTVRWCDEFSLSHNLLFPIPKLFSFSHPLNFFFSYSYPAISWVNTNDSVCKNLQSIICITVTILCVDSVGM